jgi:hypothetical protein
MTEEQKNELDILLDIVFEASKWKIEDGQDGIRLEVESRIRNLILTDKETVVSCEPEVSPVLTADDFTALEAAKLNEHLASPDKAEKAVNEWKAKRVRCQENGHPVWHLRSECVKEPRDNRNGGPAWTWKWLGPQDKKAQEEAMWAEHEKGAE